MPKLPDHLRYNPKSVTAVMGIPPLSANGTEAYVASNGKVHGPATVPALLASFVYLKKFLENRDQYCYRCWVMDSGAFSAFTSGTEIDLEAYAEQCKKLLATDPTLRHVFSLDVIGDPEGTLRNTERLWGLGVPAVPCFHYGSPWHYLTDMAKKYPKIALGGMAKRGEGGHGTALTYHKKLRFIEGCFARVWPKWIHGFACCDQRLLTRIPFAAVDSTSWLYGAARYGVMRCFKGTGRILPRKKDNPEAFEAGMRAQLAWHLRIEDDTRRRFGHILANAGLGEFNLHLATGGDVLDQGQAKTGQQPSVRVE